MKTTLSPIQWHTLNATADNWKSANDILEEIQSLVPGTDKAKLIEVVRDLFGSGLLEEMPLAGQELTNFTDMDRTWFSMTPAGRAIWDAEGDVYFPET